MLPRVILHVATSLDSQTGGFTADVETYYRLINRWNEGATLAGSETMLNPVDEIPDETDADFEPQKVDPEDDSGNAGVYAGRGDNSSYALVLLKKQ